MRIEDLDQFNKDLPYNLVDDMAIFMRNDPMFYRKLFFPKILRMKQAHNTKQEYDPVKELSPLVDKAAIIYCKKYKIPKRPEELVDDDDKQALIQKLYSEEMTNIKKGVY